jgi:quinol monooxygenase YgiN
VAVVVVANVTPDSEHREEVRRTLEDVVPRVHAEDGCELFALHESRDGFVIVEQWRDSAALKAHGDGPVFADMTGSLEGRLAAPLGVQMLKPVPAGDPTLGTLRQVP